MDYWAIDQKLHRQMDRKWYSNKPPSTTFFIWLFLVFWGVLLGFSVGVGVVVLSNLFNHIYVYSIKQKVMPTQKPLCKIYIQSVTTSFLHTFQAQFLIMKTALGNDYLIYQYL